MKIYKTRPEICSINVDESGVSVFIKEKDGSQEVYTCIYKMMEEYLTKQKKEYDKIIEKIHKNHQVELKKATDACNRNADIIESLKHHE